MSTNHVTFKKASKCPYTSPYKNGVKYEHNRYTPSIGDKLKHYKSGKSKSEKKLNALKILNSVMTVFSTVMSFLSVFGMFKMFNNQQTQTTEDKNSEANTLNVLGDEAGAKALNAGLEALTNATKDASLKDKALETIESNKDTVKQYSAQLLEVAKKEIDTDFDADKDGKISENEFTSATQKQIGEVDKDEAKLYETAIKTGFDTLNVDSATGDKFIDSEEYATFLATIDTNSNGKVEGKEHKAFMDLVSGNKTNEEVTNFQSRNVFLNGILFKADQFKK